MQKRTTMTKKPTLTIAAIYARKSTEQKPSEREKA
jgi:hypothetical protein